MNENYVNQRKQHFNENWLSWAALHHFLPTPLLRELSYVIVERISNGTLCFDQLFNEVISEGSPAFASWLIQPLQSSSRLAEYLQYRIRAFAWQSDEGGFLSLVDEDFPDARSPSLLERSIEFGAADFTSNNLSLVPDEETGQPSMEQLIRSFILVRTCFKNGRTEDFMKELDASLSSVEMPLAAVMMKHLGDLCADVDDWDNARIIYEHVKCRLEAFDNPTWSDFVPLIQAINIQSLATAVQTLQGAKESANILNAALAQSTGEFRSILYGNATFDAFVVSRQADRESNLLDIRATVLLPPLLHKTHNTSAAIGNWLNGKSNDAGTRFWAILRRQIALGSATESRATKAWYARELFDEAEQANATRNVQNTFALASRLLIESGNSKAVTKVNWSEQLISACVNQQCVDLVIHHAEIHSGTKIERQQVVIELFREWVEKIPMERNELATSMLKHLTYLALEPSSFDSDLNIGGHSLEALLSFAKKRPELRQLVITEIVDVISTHLQPVGFWTGSKDALNLASQYLDIFYEDNLLKTIEATLSMLDKTTPEAGMWPVVQPALQLLVSKAVKLFVKKRPDLGQRIVDTVLQFGLNQESENARVLFYLHNFDPALFKNSSIQDELQDAVSKVRQKASRINSSNVVEQIQALLLAPSVSGSAGIEDALNGLALILSSAKGSKQSIALSYAYDPLLLLTNNRQKIADALNLSCEQFQERLRPIFLLIIELWKEATKNPLIFTPFSFPPKTKPDSIVVHNWAFASMHFAEMLHEVSKIETILTTGAMEPLLANGIALARATQSVAGENDSFDVDAILLENRETFYSVLGRRLVVLQRLEAEYGIKLCKSLMEQCFKHGPREIDAAVFLSAIRLNLCDQVLVESYSNYKKRLENTHDLRFTLMPILNIMKSGEEANTDD